MDILTMARRRERVMRLFADINKNGISHRDKTLASFGIRTGASQARILDYFEQLVKSDMIEQKIVEGIVFCGTPAAWKEEEKEEAEKKKK
jgi:hypothetical protein